MAYLDQAVQKAGDTPAAQVPVPEEPVFDLPDPDAPIRVNWLFSGILLGAGSWLLILSLIFTALGNWIVSGALIAGFCLCVMIVWRAARRLPRVPESGHGCHRAMARAKGPSGSLLP